MIDEAIKKTLAFFSIFSHPLTKEELYQWLYMPRGKVLREVFYEKLEEVEKNNGFFAFGDDSVIERQERVKLIEKKFKIAHKAACKLRYLPFVKAIFVCNTLALGTVNKESDIDFYIITKTDRIWTVRFFANLTLKLFRLRTNAKYHSDRVCLSFFSCEKSLGLETVKTVNEDIYLLYWISSLVPIYDPEKNRKEILRANLWVQHSLPNLQADYYIHPQKQVRDNIVSLFFKKINQLILRGTLGLVCEKKMKSIQIKRLKSLGLMGLVDKKNVIIDDNHIKLHDKDRRDEFLNQWKAKIGDYEKSH